MLVSTSFNAFVDVDGYVVLDLSAGLGLLSRRLSWHIHEPEIDSLNDVFNALQFGRYFDNSMVDKQSLSEILVAR